MNFEEFKRILTSFADNPADVDLSKGQLLVQIREEIIGAEIHIREGELYVNEAGDEFPARQWLVARIGRLFQLADRILSYVPEEKTFVVPTGNLLDQLEARTNDDEVFTDDALACLTTVLSRRPAGTTSVLYLTSDAGEGKTTVIQQLARAQATAYKNKMSDWLLVPISLGGRPFLRFDDVVIAALVNQFRFQFLYYDAFLELVRLGVLVPAFDGFEEMFVESSTGEALSALGNLVKSLSSSGSVLISARKAYFDYKSFTTQAKLYDSIEADSVAFSRLSLSRWNRDQFLDYARKRQIPDGEAIYGDVSGRLGEHHPLLTRAVLVKKLLDIASTITDRGALLQKLGHAPDDYFFQFVDTIIEREANEKWIDRSGEHARPLITIPEHHALLSLLAQEMWLSSSLVLNGESLDVIADFFSEIFNKSPVIARQVKERLKQHALIVNVPSNRSLFSFDHEEFRDFFLGQAIGRRLGEKADSDSREMLRVGPLPNHTFESAAHFLRNGNYDLCKAAFALGDFSKSDVITSFTRENCGGLIVRLLDGVESASLSIGDVSFPPESLRARSLSGVTFSDCYFQTTSLDGTVLKDCAFVNCRFDGLEITRTTSITNTRMSNYALQSVCPIGHDNRIFDPSAVSSALIHAGFVLDKPEMEAAAKKTKVESDEELSVTERALRYFLRATIVTEEALNLRLGKKSTLFFDKIVPQLNKHRIVEELSHPRSGRRQFRLRVRMSEIDDALLKSDGKFQRFLDHF